MLVWRALVAGLALHAAAAAHAMGSKPAAQVSETEVSEAAMQLAGSEWGFEGEAGQGARMIQFGAEGSVSGSSGCNRFSGRYVQDGEALAIKGLITTLIGCADDVAARERELYDALHAVRRIEATHLVLKLLDADGKQLLELVRRDFD